ncbi:MAG: hypothetical protein M8350_04445 [Methanosarcinaceae archaeon]|nr:hypothetical protein [Methanosarcinaceae archaeon]
MSGGSSLENAGLGEIDIHEVREPMSFREAPQMFRKIGGFGNFLKLMTKMIKITLASKVIRKRFKKLGRSKKILVGSLLIKSASSKHVGYILGVGRKS